MMGVELSFYPVRKDLLPDWDRLESETDRSSSPDVFILVHYFGFPNGLDEAGTFCNKHDIELMEDCAHMILPINGCAEQHAAVFCPRKTLALPEGGLLTTPNTGAARQTGIEFGSNKTLIFKWLVWRMTQRAILSMGLSWHRYRGITINHLQNDYSEPMDGQMEKCQNRYSLKLLGVQEKYLGDVVEKRRANYTRLMQAIEGIEGFRPLFSSLADNVCPSVCPMIVSSERDTVLRQLNRLGITAKNWPGLPPELSERRDRHEAAIWLQNHILLLPLHQDLSHKQVEYMASKLEHIRDEGR
jgi:dTDP-4-amino-4,6-dideoxygalactose transaminase